VDSGSPNSKFGSASSLKVGASPTRESYLKFNLTGVTGTVTSAKLRVHTTTDPSAGSVKGGSVAKMSNTSWSESTVTYNTRPAIDGAPLATLGAVSVDQWYELNVTSAVTGNGTLSLGMNSISTDGAFYSSRESGSATAPQLVVTLAP
jgi:hypothetical protein